MNDWQPRENEKRIRDRIEDTRELAEKLEERIGKLDQRHADALAEDIVDRELVEQLAAEREELRRRTEAAELEVRGLEKRLPDARRKDGEEMLPAMVEGAERLAAESLAGFVEIPAVLDELERIMLRAFARGRDFAGLAREVHDVAQATGAAAPALPHVPTLTPALLERACAIFATFQQLEHDFERVSGKWPARKATRVDLEEPPPPPDHRPRAHIGVYA